MVKIIKKYFKRKYLKGWLIGAVSLSIVIMTYSPLYDDYIKQPGRYHTREYTTLTLVVGGLLLSIIYVYQIKSKIKKK
jgi:hypothetical protein